MLTVEDQPVSVERRLAAGDLCCPGCGGRLARWGFAVARAVRGLGDAVARWRPRRARCRGCGVTHVLLPAAALSRRADLAEVIGAALAAKAAGAGRRRIAGWLSRPAETVRGDLPDHRFHLIRLPPAAATAAGGTGQQVRDKALVRRPPAD